MTGEQLKLLIETAQELSLARTLDTIMGIVRRTARNLTGADGATFVLKDNDLCYYAEEDAISPLWKGQRFPMSVCISGWVMIHRQPAVIGDIYSDDRIPIDAYKPTFVKSLAMVPIRTFDPIGAIGNYWAKEHLPSEEEVQLLQSLADLTSVSMENVYIYNELEERIKQRTEQLEFLNRELEAFAYSISHDLRAPLRVISGYASTLEEEFGDKLNDEGKRITGRINSNAIKMAALIDDLLAFSKLGRKEVQRTWIDMNELTDKVLTEFNKSTVHSAKIKIDQLHGVFADYNLIYQVMCNLISNAVKYSSKKKNPSVEISSAELNEEIVFSVKDNGAGFDMQYVDKLFGVFQRLHSQEEFEGTGAGLALVQRIIFKHGGKIWAEGKVNKGATFQFSIKKQQSI